MGRSPHIEQLRPFANTSFEQRSSRFGRHSYCHCCGDLLTECNNIH